MRRNLWTIIGCSSIFATAAGMSSTKSLDDGTHVIRPSADVSAVAADLANKTNNNNNSTAAAIAASPPLHHCAGGQGFRNIWPEWQELGFWKAMNYMRTRKLPPTPDQAILEQKIPVVPVNHDQLFDLENSVKDSQVMWAGHASFVIQMDKKTILLDPVWSERCSPSQLFGPRRIRPPPLQVRDLPKVDFVLLSHNHYDHLDASTVMELEKLFQPTFLVPMGLSGFFNFVENKSRVKELDWWETHLDRSSSLRISFVPAQHWSTRAMWDKNKSLWGGWVMASDLHRIYFSGDTGYCSVFKEIGERLGPFDLSLLPLGAYAPRCIMRPQHVDPLESVKMHQDLSSTISLGMHWGTFVLSNEPIFDPPCRLKFELEKAGIPRKQFGVCAIGDVMKVNELMWGGVEAIWEKHFKWARAEDAAIDNSENGGGSAIGGGGEARRDKYIDTMEED